MSYASLPPVFQVRAKELDLLGKPPGVLYFSSSSSLIHPTAAGRSNLPAPTDWALQNTFANNQSSGAISRRRPSKKEVPLYFHPERRFSDQNLFTRGPVSRALLTGVHTDQTSSKCSFNNPRIGKRGAMG